MAQSKQAPQMPFANFGDFTVGSDVARKSFERSTKMMTEVSAFNKQNLTAMTESAKVAGKAMEEISARAAAFSKESVEDMMSTGRAVTSAKSVKEAMEVQAEYVKTAFDRYLEELNAVTGLMASSMKNCFEPLNAQAGELVAIMQRRV